VLEATAFDTNSFLWRSTCVSSTQLHGPVWNKVSLSPSSKTLSAGSIPFKVNSILKGHNVLHASALNTYGYPSGDTCVSSTRLNRPIGNKGNHLPLETPKWQ
jgi:hypothetical protein